MANGDIQPYDWFRKFFGNNRSGYRDFDNTDFFDMNLLRDFDEIQSQMQRMFNQFDNPNHDANPKELIKEYQVPDGSKVRQVGPIVYGYSMTIGPDGKSRIQEFGNVRPSKTGFGMSGSRAGPQLTDEREPLVDISTTNDQVLVVFEMPGVKKEDLKINVSEDSVEVQSTDLKRKYHKTIELPKEINIESAKSKFNNGVLEITFNKKKETKPKGKEIKID